MAYLTRRGLIKVAGGMALAATALGTDAFAIEPLFLLETRTYDLVIPRWPASLDLRIAVVADIHACRPWMGPERIRQIAEAANATKPDVIALLGDYNPGHNVVTGAVMPEEWAEALSVLSAPLGVFSILGNHDWWHGPLTTIQSDNGESARRGLRRARIEIIENKATRLTKQGEPFWLMGLGDLMAIETGRHRHRGVDDIPGTMAQIRDDAPIVLLAHEPFVFPRVPERVALTLAGHTHGGQVRLPLVGTPFAQERFYHPWIYGHMTLGERHIIVSAGLGESILPMRLMCPPELVVVNVKGGGEPAKPRLAGT